MKMLQRITKHFGSLKIHIWGEKREWKSQMPDANNEEALAFLAPFPLVHFISEGAGGPFPSRSSGFSTLSLFLFLQSPIFR